MTTKAGELYKNRYTVMIVLINVPLSLIQNLEYTLKLDFFFINDQVLSSK